MEPERDAVDVILEQWRAERPDLDPSPMGVFGRLSRTSQQLDRRLQENFARFELQHWEFDVLATLRRSGAPYRLTAGGLVASSMVTSGAVTNRIDRLVARGLVDRGVDPTNRRSVLVTLTAAGLALVDEAVAAHVRHEETLLAGLTADDRTKLVELLRTLSRSLAG